MSSTIKLPKFCNHCGKAFIAQKTTTQFCGHPCASKAYKQRKREEKVNTEFYHNLIRQFPTLTKSEVDLCGLLKLNLSNKEISALKNVSPDSVKMARNRLRKKIGIQPEEDIYAFISKI